MARPGSDARERAIEAAFTLAKVEGATGFTLDAVAREAGLSKGGLLHHFNTKESLIEAMIETLVTRFEQATASIAASDSNPVGRFTRAFLQVISAPALTHDSKVLLSAVALNPALLNPLRASQQRCFARFVQDGIDPLNAQLIALAADALWLHTIFDLPGPGAEQRALLLEKMQKLSHKRPKK